MIEIEHVNEQVKISSVCIPIRIKIELMNEQVKISSV